ncbi:MAG: hypothetical protein OEU36_05750 [Gammaproteobacteria bacterium]|nr:hypothetical protein [Gammaproteobacteria bacterium]
MTAQSNTVGLLVLSLGLVLESSARAAERAAQDVVIGDVAISTDERARLFESDN